MPDYDAAHYIPIRQCPDRQVRYRSETVLHTLWREAPSAPPLGELLSEREAEGVRLDEWNQFSHLNRRGGYQPPEISDFSKCPVEWYNIQHCTIQRTTPSQAARSGCQLSQRESQGRFAPWVSPNRI